METLIKQASRESEREIALCIIVSIFETAIPFPQVAELQEQLEDEANELKRFRTRTTQLEGDVDRMRRELTDERFERERTTQELRRVQRHQSINRALDALDTKEGTRPPPVQSSDPHPTPASSSSGGVPSRAGSSPASASEANSQLERRRSFSKAHAGYLHSSSSDTGLERSQPVSSSSDSHKEPWRLAFGSRTSKLDWQTASHDSLHQSPLTYRKATGDSPQSRLEASKVASPVAGTSGISSSLPQLPQAPPSSAGRPNGGSAPLSPKPDDSSKETTSVRPKESRYKLSRQGASAEDSGSRG